jgi:hypothetical protein
MKEFNSIKQLIENCNGLSNDAFIFSLDAAVKEGNPSKGGIAVLEAEEEAALNDESGINAAYETSMRYLMEVETFKKLIRIQKEKNPESGINDFVKVIELYLSSDEVLD